MGKTKKEFMKAVSKLAKKKLKREQKEEKRLVRYQELSDNIDILVAPIVSLLEKEYKNPSRIIMQIQGDGSWSLSKEELSCTTDVIDTDDDFLDDTLEEDANSCTSCCCGK